jgi:hypothetical protein
VKICSALTGLPTETKILAIYFDDHPSCAHCAD